MYENPKNIAALIMETVGGSSGALYYDLKYMQGIR